MIENKIQLMPLDGIETGRDTRFRTKLESDHIRQLAKQIQDHGLIHAILLDAETGQLIAGENRISAFEYLRTIGAECKFKSYQDWTYIPARRAKDVSLLQRRTMELSENIGSCPMTWQDISAGLIELQRLMKSEDEDLTQAEIARTLGMTDSQVSRYLLAGRHLNEPDIRECTSLITAANILSRRNDRKLDGLMDSLSFSQSSAPSPAAGTEEEALPLDLGEAETRTMAAGRASPADPYPTLEAEAEPQRFTALPGSFLDWAQDYRGQPFNLIHFDPPYGIGLDKSSTMKKSGRAQYADSEDLFHLITDTLLQEQDKIISRSAHILFWHSAEDRELVKEKLTQAGWRVWLYPLIWHKSCNTGLFPDSNRGPRHTYEMATLASRGDRKIVRLVADSYSAAATKASGHESEKPLEMLKHFFRMLVDDSTRILDPTAGSFNSLHAAKALGADSGLGIELEPYYTKQFNMAMRQKEPQDA